MRIQQGLLLLSPDFKKALINEISLLEVVVLWYKMVALLCA
jgi:hypothetical protein